MTKKEIKKYFNNNFIRLYVSIDGLSDCLMKVSTKAKTLEVSFIHISRVDGVNIFGNNFSHLNPKIIEKVLKTTDEKLFHRVVYFEDEAERKMFKRFLIKGADEIFKNKIPSKREIISLINELEIVKPLANKFQTSRRKPNPDTINHLNGICEIYYSGLLNGNKLTLHKALIQYNKKEKFLKGNISEGVYKANQDGNDKLECYSDSVKKWIPRISRHYNNIYLPSKSKK